MAIIKRNLDEPISLDFLKPKHSNNIGTVNHVFCKFQLDEEIGFNEDPTMHAMSRIGDWTKTDKGMWCVENATDLKLYIQRDISTLLFHVAVTGKLTPKHSTFWTLKFS